MRAILSLMQQCRTIGEFTLTESDGGVTLTELNSLSPAYLMFYPASNQELAAEEYSNPEFTDLRLARIARSISFYMLQFNHFCLAREFLSHLFRHEAGAVRELWLDTDVGTVLDRRAVLERMKDPVWDWRRR